MDHLQCRNNLFSSVLFHVLQALVSGESSASSGNAAADQAAAEKEPSTAKAFCGECGWKNEKLGPFCGECGTSLKL